MCSDAHIEVKKQLCGISSLLPLFMVSRDELRCLTCLVRAFTHWTITLKHCKVFCFVLNQLCTNTFKKIVINLLNYEYKNKTSFDQVLNEFNESKAGRWRNLIVIGGSLHSIPSVTNSLAQLGRNVGTTETGLS